MTKVSKVINEYEKKLENLYGMSKNEFFSDLDLVKHERSCLYFINSLNESEENTIIIEFLDAFISQVEA